ncbi:MAG: hypothetical protein ACLFWG_04640 [Longimicrobiales bacterium]
MSWILERHPDLSDSSPLEAALDQATRGWGESDRPKPLTVYQHDPVAFADEVLGVPAHTLRWSLNQGYEFHPWDGTKDPIAAMMDGLAAGENVGVESGTGTGKSFGLAIIILWFVACWEMSRVYTFAPKEKQLRHYSWTELRKLWPRFKRKFPRARLLDLRIQMIPGSDEWGAVGWPVGVGADEDVATRAAGMHAEHMLLIYEEGPGISEAVYKAGENTCTGEHNLRLAVGNPDHQHDPLHLFCTKPTVRHIRASALDFPNVVLGRAVIPGAVGRRRVLERLEEYGATGRLFESRVRGISPSESADALIRRSWLEACAKNYADADRRAELEVVGGGLPALGVDVADSEEGDEVCIVEGVGAVTLEVTTKPARDNALELAYEVETRQAAMGALDRHVGVDNAGVGTNVMNKGKELGHRWEGLNPGGKVYRRLDEDLLEGNPDPTLVGPEDGRTVIDEGEYRNLRAQMWWQARVDLMRGRVAIPPEAEAPKLWKDLLTPTWTTLNGVIVVEAKEKMRERLGRSPDSGDAWVNWNWVRERIREKEEEPPPSAWDPEMLEAERELRRVRADKPRPYRSPLDALGV